MRLPSLVIEDISSVSNNKSDELLNSSGEKIIL